jgi:hypothetical protein
VWSRCGKRDSVIHDLTISPEGRWLVLYLNFENIETIQLIGLDYDPDTLNDAESLAAKQNLRPMITLHQADAWQMTFHNEFDLISSNGLNIGIIFLINFSGQSSRIGE